MCLYPKLILNKKYTANKSNKGVIPTMEDPRAKYVPIGCGKCMECMRQKARKWQIRLMEEIRTDKRGKFVTFSFSDQSLIDLEKELKLPENLDSYTRDNKIATLAVKRFRERWRKKYGVSIKHWLCTELGQNSTERLHIHGIVWITAKKKVLEELWKYGNVNKKEKNWEMNYVTERTVNYIVKYLSKTDEKHKYYTPIVLTSPGIGWNYINRPDAERNKYNGEKTIETYTTRQGIKLNLPIYYRNKIYTDEQREKLWMNLLDKKIRYVNKIKVDVSENEDEYYELLRWERARNKALGYGDDEINWSKKQYEQKLRNLKRLERIKKYSQETNPKEATE